MSREIPSSSWFELAAYSTNVFNVNDVSKVLGICHQRCSIVRQKVSDQGDSYVSIWSLQGTVFKDERNTAQQAKDELFRVLEAKAGVIKSLVSDYGIKLGVVMVFDLRSPYLPTLELSAEEMDVLVDLDVWLRTSYKTKNWALKSSQSSPIKLSV